jgi:hypothetical protein
MPDPAAIFALAEKVDLDPDQLGAPQFRRELRDALATINGQFTKRVSERGIDRDDALVWFGGIEALVNQAEAEQLGFAEAADLAVRLCGLSFIISEQEAELEADELLISAPPAR